MARKLNMFGIYALEDKDVMLDLSAHLDDLRGTYDLNLWLEDAVIPGEPWQFHFESRASHTEVFVLLLSEAFMKTGFMRQPEFKLVMDRQKEQKSVVIPILLEQCDWDEEFDLGDYQFSLKDLPLLPEEGQPLKEWGSLEEAYGNIASGINSIIKDLVEHLDQKRSKKKRAKSEESGQVAISFDPAENKANDMEENSESQQEIGQKASSREEAEARRRAEVAKRIREAAEASARRREEEDRLWEEALEKRRLEKARRIREEAALADQQPETENGFREEHATVKSKRAERKKRSRSAKVAKSDIPETKRPEKTSVTAPSTTPAQAKTKVESSGEKPEKASEASNIFTKRNIIRAAMGAVFVVLIIWLFSLFGNSTENEAPEAAATNETKVEATDNSESADEESVTLTEAAVTFAVGDYHQEGIIFELNTDNNTGKIAHLDDAGPMPWQDANKIDEQLGAGWRLPSFEELQSMYNSIGQGADNKGEFTNGLYWSSTPFEEHQARLLRFLDGNTSYHYNRHVEHRSYRVRAIKDFGW
ncbi:TIR domain-containing protein [Poritiphilus flavus]|uniref:TIR domain-containing protein n=1 Tax=Poritiphilus flavus TaxID=2697053 RepID=A0A6L9EEI5_9FLAO|nr:TIR domain-containing protein [Poritiphilus flavus]NAS13071.1 TIR domain-containing protein [Poritiphilus flavus]